MKRLSNSDGRNSFYYFFMLEEKAENIKLRRVERNAEEQKEYVNILLSPVHMYMRIEVEVMVELQKQNCCTSALHHPSQHSFQLSS